MQDIDCTHTGKGNGNKGRETKKTTGKDSRIPADEVFAGAHKRGFALKAGLGIGGAICGAIVDSFGFVSNTVQTENAIFGIRLTSSVIPAITFFVGVIALFFYPISKKLNEHIQDDLAKRRLENN